MRTILPVVIGATLALCAIEAAAQAAPGDRQVALAIESKTLADALDQWAQQSGFQILLKNWDVAKELAAPRLKGTFSAQAALEQLLSGTPLVYEFTSERTVTVRVRVTQAVSTKGRLDRVDVSLLHLAALDAAEELRADGSSAAPVEPAQRQSRAGRRGEEEDVEELEEVVVTGTHLKNAYAAGSPIRTYSRREIAASGALTTAQFTDLIPQNFGGGVSQDTASTFVPPDGRTNANEGYGTGINLRGLGADATLVLLNGHRLTQTGAGTFVDVSQVPISAIERIDVLTDGASAIYGSDAVAGVVNIILRHDFDGAETRLRYGSVTDGDFAQYGIGQTLGTTWDRGGAFLSYDFFGQDNLSRADRPFASLPVGDLLPHTSAHSALLSGFQRVGAGSFRYDLIYSQRHAQFIIPESSASIAPDRSIAAPSEAYSGALSFSTPLGPDWSADISLLHSSSDVRSSTSSLDGTPIIRVDGIHKNRLSSIGANIAGTIGRAPGGPILANMGLDYRRERFEADVLVESVSFQPLDDSRTIRSVFAEAFVPLIDNEDTTGGQSLDLSLAVRHERYSDFGDTTNPKVGIAWHPIDALKLRGTYGTSFRAPAFDQNTDSTGATLLTFLPDPDETNQSLALVRAGTKSGVGPERAKTWTAGIEWSADSSNDLILTLDYFTTRYRDRIQLPSSAPFSVLTQDAVYSPIINRNPSLADIDDAIANPGGFGFSDLTDGQDPANVVVIVDGRIQNIAITKLSGIDIGLVRETTWKEIGWRLSFDGTYFSKYRNQISRAASGVDVEGTVFNPPRWRARGGIGARTRDVMANIFANYLPSYDNNLTTPTGAIDSWATVDASIVYEFPESGTGLLRNTAVSFSAQNVFDKTPPRVSGSGAITLLPVGYDAANANALQRFLSLELRKKF